MRSQDAEGKRMSLGRWGTGGEWDREARRVKGLVVEESVCRELVE